MAVARSGFVSLDCADHRWRVLLDPAGHRSCLTTQIPAEAR